MNKNTLNEFILKNFTKEVFYFSNISKQGLDKIGFHFEKSLSNLHINEVYFHSNPT
jgi:hypothetical protein